MDILAQEVTRKKIMVALDMVDREDTEKKFSYATMEVLTEALAEALELCDSMIS